MKCSHCGKTCTSWNTFLNGVLCDDCVPFEKLQGLQRSDTYFFFTAEVPFMGTLQTVTPLHIWFYPYVYIANETYPVTFTLLAYE